MRQATEEEAAVQKVTQILHLYTLVAWSNTIQYMLKRRHQISWQERAVTELWKRLNLVAIEQGDYHVHYCPSIGLPY